MATRRKRESRASPTDAAKLLLAAYHLRLLGVLYMRPDETFHVRELERMTGMNPGTVHRELKRMRTAGVVTSRELGNQVRYQADRSCPIFPELQGIVRKTVGLRDVLRDALQPLASRIDRAFVFGSIASGDERPGSDIDVLVVGEAPFTDVAVALHACQEELARQVNPIVLTPGEFAHRRGEAGFIQRVIAAPKIALIGTADDA